MSSQLDWDEDAGIHCFGYGIGALLVDSEGATYALEEKQKGASEPMATQQYLSLQEVTSLVRAHMAVIGQCCVSKFSVRTIEQAILAADLED